MYAKQGQGRWFIPILVLAMVCPSYGQVLDDWEIQTANFASRVKNIEFFFDRFNNQPDGTGRIILPEHDSISLARFYAERRQRVFALFDVSQMNRNDLALKQKLVSFFADINKPGAPTFLTFTDKAWMAEVVFDARLNDRPGTLTCNMQVAKSPEGVHTWTIRSFHSPQWDITEKADSLFTFAPTVHGTDFMDVRLKLQDTTWMRTMLAKTSSISQTATHITTGELTIARVAHIRYFLLQVPGWLIDVRYVNRSTPDSGWLIHAVEQLPPTEKSTMMEERLLQF